MKYILYCAFNKQVYINEAVYSIMSLCSAMGRCREDTRIVVFTDNISSFEKVFGQNSSIILRHIPQQMVASWIGRDGYNFRLKIRAIQHFFEKYEGDMVYIDSDTVILDDISHLFDIVSKKQFLLYSRCVSMDETLDKFSKDPDSDRCNIQVARRIELYRDIKNNSGYIATKKYPLPENFYPYNSGVIGISPSYRELLDDVLILSDDIYTRYSYGNAEEFAFSYIFSSHAGITRCDDVIFHYYYYKKSRVILGRIFEYLHEDDKNQFNGFLQETGISEDLFDKFKLSVKDIPYFIYFALNSLANTQSDGVDHKAMIYSYFDKDDYFFRATNNFTVFKRFIKTWHEDRQNNVSK